MEKDYIQRDNTHRREIHMERRDIHTNKWKRVAYKRISHKGT